MFLSIDVDTSIHGLQSSLIVSCVIFPSKILQFMPFSLVRYITMKLVRFRLWNYKSCFHYPTPISLFKNPSHAKHSITSNFSKPFTFIFYLVQWAFFTTRGAMSPVLADMSDQSATVENKAKINLDSIWLPKYLLPCALCQSILLQISSALSPPWV